MTLPSFIGLDDMTAYLGETVTGDDLLAVAALDAACQAIRSYTEQDLNLSRHDTVTLHGNKYRELLLPQLPVLAVHEVTEDDETVDADDVHLGEAGILYRTGSPHKWAAGIGNIQVEYTHGWGATEDELDESGEPTADRMPSDLRMIALRVAQGVYDHLPANVTQESLGSYSYTQASTVLIESGMTVILDRYRVAT